MDDLKFLKKHYGENFSHLCRELFPTLLEPKYEGLLSGVISSRFAPSRSLYYDILPYFKDDFKSYIYSFINVEKEIPEKNTKTPKELLDEAGYILFPECQTEEDIQSYKKYWAEGEELCTFRGGRLQSCRVWFAVKKNIDQIKREDYKRPQRQDEYGTSAISIQFTRRKDSTLSIKNRYNHTVNNPDATFSNNLDNIISGLTQAFVDTYGISLIKDNRRFELPGYRLGEDGKFYKVNLEDDDICYCENNIVLDHGTPMKIEPSRYILAENYIIDKNKNKIIRYKNNYVDSFIVSFGEIKGISTTNDEEGNRVVVFTPEKGENVELTLSESDAIIGLNNPNVTEVGDDFLNINEKLKTLKMPKLESVGNNFLHKNDSLIELSLPKLENVRDRFISCNFMISHLSLPKLKKVGDGFLNNNHALTDLSLPNLEVVENNFLCDNKRINHVSLPKLKDVEFGFLNDNTSLTELSLPNLERAGDAFLVMNESLKNLSLPKLKEIGYNALYYNYSLTELSLPNLTKVGNGFIPFNYCIKKASLPKLKTVGNSFLEHNEALTELSLPNLQSVGSSFLYINKSLRSFYAPKLETVKHYFLKYNEALTELSLPNLQTVDDKFLYENKSLRSFYAPKLKNCPEKFKDVLNKGQNNDDEAQ